MGYSAICTSLLIHLVYHPKVCITFVFYFLLGYYNGLKEIKGKAYAKFVGGGGGGGGKQGDVQTAKVNSPSVMFMFLENPAYLD